MHIEKRDTWLYRWSVVDPGVSRRVVFMTRWGARRHIRTQQKLDSWRRIS